MGYWGIKAFDSDQALDDMDWIVTFNKEQIPFVTHLFLKSHDEHQIMLGLLISACCEKEPTQDFISEYNSGEEYLPWLKNVHKMYKNDKEFMKGMSYFVCGLYDAKVRLKGFLKNWTSSTKEREDYINELYNACF